METITKETETINVTDQKFDSGIQKAEHYLDEFKEGMSIEFADGFYFGLGIVTGKVDVE